MFYGLFPSLWVRPQVPLQAQGWKAHAGLCTKALERMNKLLDWVRIHFVGF